MAVFWEKSVPIPKMVGITINRGDKNRVLLVKEAPYNAKLGYAQPKRNTIGYVCKDKTSMMHPTDKFKSLFPHEWEKMFSEKVPLIVKHIGMYAALDAINEKIGIKDILDKTLGTTASDSLMDFTMYSMLYHTNVAEHFDKMMRDQMLFSGNPHSDSHYSELFAKKISHSDILLFKKEWALQCKADGVEEVWICIDGSNDDCESVGVIFAEKGHAKSLRNRNIISFTYAITNTGKPVTFDLYRGGLVDAKAMKRIISFLQEIGIRVRGVILDRGYCDSSALRFLNENHIPYVIMVKGSPSGYGEIVGKYGAEIKMNANYLVEGTTMFAAQEEIQLFDNYEHKDYVTLFFDYTNAGDRITTLLKKLWKEMKNAREKIANGCKPVIDPKLQRFLRYDPEKNDVELVKSELQLEMDDKGLYALVSSEKLSAKELHDLYSSRNASETTYMIVKTQLGYGRMRVHATLSTQTKFMEGFISSIVRFEFEQGAKPLNRTSNEMIQEMNMLIMTRLNESYTPVQDVVSRQLDFLKRLGAPTDLLTLVAKDENDRLAGRLPTPRHKKPGPKKKAASRHKASSETRPERKRPGVPPGTKRGEFNKDGTPRKKPGVQKGYKRGEFNKDGSPRKKPGRKAKTNVT